MKRIVTFFLVLGALLTCTTLRADYGELRQLSGSPGQQHQLNAGKISGTFTFQTEDPFGTGDDGGIVIRSPNGYWVRAFSHTSSDPIRLDWFEFQNGDVVSGLLITLAQRYSPRLFVQMPSDSMQLIHNSGTVDWTSNYGITEFRLLESAVETSILVTNNNAREVWEFGSMTDLVIGSAVEKPNRDDYKFTLIGPWRPDNRGETDQTAGGIRFVGAVGMIDVDHDADNNADLVFRFDSKYPLSCSVRVYGNGNRTVYYSGVHRFGGCLSSGGQYTGRVHFEDAYVSDELAFGVGWDGNPSGAYDLTKSHWRGQRSTQVANGGVTAERLQITGEVTAQYGIAGFNWFFPDVIGEGASAPLVLNIKDHGWTGPNELGWPVGIELDDPYANDHPIKSDGLGEDLPGQRFFMFTETNQWGKNSKFSKRSWFGENAQCDDNPNCGGTITTSTNWTYVNAQGNHYYQNGTHPTDAIRDNVFQGDGVNPAFADGKLYLTYRDTARYGQFHDIEIDDDLTDVGGDNNYGDNNTLTNVTMTGSLTVDTNGTGNVATNLTFIGSARQVATVNGAISITNLCAPANTGYVINGSGSLTVNGSGKSMPFTITSADCTDGANPDIPANPSFFPSSNEPSLGEGIPLPPRLLVGN